MMRNCFDITTQKRKGHKWIKERIKELEKVENKTPLDQWKLCNAYHTLAHAPFMEDGFYDLCVNCELKTNPDEVFKLI